MKEEVGLEEMALATSGTAGAWALHGPVLDRLRPVLPVVPLAPSRENRNRTQNRTAKFAVAVRL